MSKLILILLAICPVVLKAQSDDKLRVKDMNIASAKGPLYVVDDKKMSEAAYRAMPPATVFSYNTLGDSAGRAQYGAEGANGVVVITTNARSIPSYRNRFMALSADYKGYLDSHSYDDKEFIYVLDEVQLQNDNNRYRILDGIPGDKLVSVTVKHGEPGFEKGLTRIHIITKR